MTKVDYVVEPGEQTRSQYVLSTGALYRQLVVWAKEGKIPDIEFREGQGVPNQIDDIIFKLFDRADMQDVMNNWDDSFWDIINKVCGPNGWTMYKAILARKKTNV